jgi:TOMM system kinase/cyclase fusion protein
VLGETVAEIIYRQLSAEPVPLPVMLQDHPLGRMLARATAKHPAAREATAAGLLTQLDACDLSSLRQPAGLGGDGPSGASATTNTLGAGEASHAASRALPSSSGERVVGSERRQVTALCCSVAVVPTGEHPVDVEDLDHLLGAEQDACIRIARREGGYFAGSLGDQVLFYFGYPAAGEGDAPRAARAALDIARDSNRRAEGEGDRRVRIELRSGIHTGIVIASAEGAAGGQRAHAAGTTSRIAALLSSLAAPSAALVSGETRRLLEGRFLLDPSSARPLDVGKIESDVFVLREATTSQGASRASTPLVGREREITALLEQWARVRGGAGQALLVTGEAGIGKSRLVRELASRLSAEPHLWLECRCSPDRTNSAFAPLIELFRGLIDPGREATPEAGTEQLLALLARYGFEPAEAMPLFAPLLGLPLPAGLSPLDVSPQKQRQLTIDAILSLLFEMAEREPVAFVVEDVHWADPSTLQLLHQLVGEVGAARVFAFFSARPEFVPTWSTTAGQQLPLGRLGREDVLAIAARVVHGRAIPSEVLDQIAARTDGVPLFVEELVRSLLDAGVLVESEGGYVLAKPLDEVSIPSTLRDSLAGRLDRLGRAKETAQIAAAIGREFALDLLAAASPQQEAALREDLDHLVAAEIVHRRRRLKGSGYVFKHALIRDAAYDSMPKGRRREIHELLGRSLERDFPALAGEQPEVAARHFEHAGLDPEATGYLLSAGQRALQRSATIEATALLRRGLALVDGASGAVWTSRRELELRAILAGAILTSRGYCDPELETNGLRARELCGASGDPLDLLPVVFTLWTRAVVQGDTDGAEARSRELLAIAEKHATREIQLSAYSSYGTTCYFSQRFDEAREWLLKTIALYDPSLHPSLVRTFGDDHGLFAYAHLIQVLLYVGDVDDALRYEGQQRALTAQLGNPLATAVAGVYTLAMYHMLGRREDMEAEAEKALALASKHGFFHWEMLARIGHGLTLVRRGEVDAGFANMRMGLGYLAMVGQWTARPYWTLFLIEALLFTGATAEAQQLIETTIEGTTGKLDQSALPLLLRAKAGILAAAGDLDGALAVRRQALAKALEQGANLPALSVSLDLARAAVAAGQPDEARTYLTPALKNIQAGAGFPDHDQSVALLATIA